MCVFVCVCLLPLLPRILGLMPRRVHAHTERERERERERDA